MKVNHQQGQEGDPQLAFGKSGDEQRDQDSPKRAVQQEMVIMLVIERPRAAKQAVDAVQNQAQAIGVRQDARQGDQAAVAGIIGRLGADNPTGQQMGFQIHAGGLSRRQESNYTT